MCFVYLEIALALLAGLSIQEAYTAGCKTANDFLSGQEWWHEKEKIIFDGILTEKLMDRNENEIASSGYVIHTLEAALWCLLNTTNYETAVLKAVNLGEDTDSTAAVAGGLAGLAYGWESIPRDWLADGVRLEDIGDLSDRLRLEITKNGKDAGHR